MIFKEFRVGLINGLALSLLSFGLVFLFLFVTKTPINHDYFHTFVYNVIFVFEGIDSIFLSSPFAVLYFIDISACLKEIYPSNEFLIKITRNRNKIIENKSLLEIAEIILKSLPLKAIFAIPTEVTNSAVFNKPVSSLNFLIASVPLTATLP